MIRCFVKHNASITLIDNISDLHQDILKDIVWVDMLMPTQNEIRFIEEKFSVKFPTKQETEEIEISSRY